MSDVVEVDVPWERKASTVIGGWMESGAFWRKIGARMKECSLQITSKSNKGVMEVKGNPGDIEHFLKWYEWLISEPD